jgi:predicted metalloendopeptidase
MVTLYLKKIKVRTYRWAPEQRFFISWTTVWRTKSRDEAIKNQVKRIHSPECTVRMYRLKMLMLLSGI